jgi:hypothetical protein
MSARSAARRTRLALFVVVLAVAGLAACESADEPGPRAIDGVFPPTAELPQLPFRVADLTGSVRSVSIGNADAPLEGVQPVPGRDDALSVIWIGGLCDRHVLVTLDGSADGMSLNVATEHDFGGCGMAGVIRHLVVEFTGPVDASSVSLSLRD